LVRNLFPAEASFNPDGFFLNIVFPLIIKI
jgi:hypothetical protein